MNSEELIKQGTGVSVEFLPSMEGQYRVAQILVSFANSKGGSLFIGVKKNGKICGIHPDHELMYLDEVLHLIEGEVNLTHSVHQIRHYLVLEITIEQLPKSVRSKSLDGKWYHYIRVESETIMANKIISHFFYMRDGNQAVVLSEDHTVLLNELKYGTRNLSMLYKLTPFKPKKIDKFLSELLVLNLIDYQYRNETFYYFCLE